MVIYHSAVLEGCNMIQISDFDSWFWGKNLWFGLVKMMQVEDNSTGSFQTFLLSLILVKMACTLHVLLNIAPNERVNPMHITQVRACSEQGEYLWRTHEASVQHAIQHDTHRAHYCIVFLRDETSVRTHQKDTCVSEYAPQDDQVIHIGTGHFDVPAMKIICQS